MLVPKLDSNVAGVNSSVADIIDLPTHGSADGPVVRDGDDLAIKTVPCGALGPADNAPVFQDEVDPVIPDAVAPMCDCDRDGVAPKIS